MMTFFDNGTEFSWVLSILFPWVLVALGCGLSLCLFHMKVQHDIKQVYSAEHNDTEAAPTKEPRRYFANVGMKNQVRMVRLFFSLFL